MVKKVKNTKNKVDIFFDVLKNIDRYAEKYKKECPEISLGANLKKQLNLLEKELKNNNLTRDYLVFQDEKLAMIKVFSVVLGLVKIGKINDTLACLIDAIYQISIW